MTRRAFFTSPWRGEVDRAKRDRVGVTICKFTPPRAPSLRFGARPSPSRGG
jgi:hypothetical protein